MLSMPRSTSRRRPSTAAGRVSKNCRAVAGAEYGRALYTTAFRAPSSSRLQLGLRHGLGGDLVRSLEQLEVPLLRGARLEEEVVLHGSALNQALHVLGPGQLPARLRRFRGGELALLGLLLALLRLPRLTPLFLLLVLLPGVNFGLLLRLLLLLLLGRCLGSLPALLRLLNPGVIAVPGLTAQSGTEVPRLAQLVDLVLADDVEDDLRALRGEAPAPGVAAHLDARAHGLQALVALDARSGEGILAVDELHAVPGELALLARGFEEVDVLTGRQRHLLPLHAVVQVEGDGHARVAAVLLREARVLLILLRERRRHHLHLLHPLPLLVRRRLPPCGIGLSIVCEGGRHKRPDQHHLPGVEKGDLS